MRLQNSSFVSSLFYDKGSWMRLGMVEGLGVEARLVEHQGGGLSLGIYCANCAAGIALVVLTHDDDTIPSEFDWQSDHNVLVAIDNHQKKHPLPSA
jgi:hypothetical protein